jgi:hypothetical protein
MEIGSGFEAGGFLLLEPPGTHRDRYPETAGVLRCRSCGSLMVPGDQGIHERFHTIVDRALFKAGHPDPRLTPGWSDGH